MLFLILTDAELPHAFTRFQMCASSDIDYPCWGHLLHRCCFSNTKQTEALKSQDVLAAMFSMHRKASPVGMQLFSGSISLAVFRRKRLRDNRLGGCHVMEIFFQNENEESFRQVTNDFPRDYM